MVNLLLILPILEEMKYLKNLKGILALSGIILILMLIRVTGNHGFPGDLQKTVAKASTRAFLISPKVLAEKKEPVILLRMDATTVPGELQKYPVLQINAGETGRRDIIRKIKAAEGLHVIIPGNQTEAMKTWVILSQEGIEDLFILDSFLADQEQAKFKFTGVEVSNLQSE
jgi:hypothetical protein